MRAPQQARPLDTDGSERGTWPQISPRKQEVLYDRQSHAHITRALIEPMGDGPGARSGTVTTPVVGARRATRKEARRALCVKQRDVQNEKTRRPGVETRGCLWCEGASAGEFSTQPLCDTARRRAYDNAPVMAGDALIFER